MITGIIGDLHLPFEDDRYLDFCLETFDRFKVEKVVQIGDLLDNHAVSFHESNVNGFSAGAELRRAREKLREWMKAFKDVLVLEGNHDRLVERQFLKNGIPSDWQKSFSEVLEFTNGWSYQNYDIIDDVLYEHGEGYVGKNGALTKAINERRSCVIGHSHAFAGVQYQSNNFNTIFGLNVGCGIDISEYAFEYGRYFKNQPVISCGIVEDGENAFCIKMKEGKYGFNA